MSRPVPNPGILDIAPYTPGKTPVPERGRKVFKLSANETPFGPSPKALAAYREAAAHLEDYPEGTSRVLREAIGRAFGLDPFFFQAEDGIRDVAVTGVQTCALPI